MSRLIALTCLLCLATASAGENRHEWPQFKGGPGFVGYSPDESVKPPFKLLWEFRVDADGSGDASCGVLVADNKVFVGMWSIEAVVAIDAHSGKFLWETPLKGLSGRTSIAYADGRVFAVRARNNIMVALDANTGKELWHSQLKGKSSIYTARFRNGIAVWKGKVFGLDHGAKPAVVALDVKTGKPVWRAALDPKYGKDLIPPCVAGGKVFAGISTVTRKPKSGGGATYALDAATGREIWRREGVCPVVSPSSDGQLVVIPLSTKADAKTRILDAATGKDAGGNATIKQYFRNSYLSVTGKGGKFTWPLDAGCNTPTVAGGFALFGTSKPTGFKGTKKGSTGGKGFCNEYGSARDAGYGWTLHAANLATGKKVWNHSSAFNVCGEPAIAYGRLYQISGGGHIYCYAPAKKGEPTTPEAVDKSPNAAPSAIRKLLAEKVSMDKGWPMAGGSPERNGRAGLTIRAPLASAWKFKTGERVLCEPAIAGGRVFIGSNDGSLYAIDATGGKQVWSLKTGAPVRCAPAVADGVVYAGSDNGFMYALDASSGREKWKFKCGGPVRGAPAVVGGVVFFGANDHNVYALDRKTGKKLWNFRTRYYRHHAAPVVHGDTVYILPGMDYVHAVDIASGKEKWKSFCCKTGEALVWHRDRLWAHGWCLAELDAETGKVTRFVNGSPYGYNRVAFLKNVMYAAGTGRPRAYNLDDPGKQASLGEHSAGRIPGKKSAIVKLRGGYSSPASSPLPLGDKLCFATKKGEVVLTKPDGSALWTAELGATCHASPAVGEGLLVIGDDKGIVHCFREK